MEKKDKIKSVWRYKRRKYSDSREGPTNKILRR